MRRLALALALAAAASLAGVAGAAPKAKPAPARAASGEAAALFAKAEEAFTALKADTRAQRQRQSFLRVLEGYRVLFERHPATRQAELSLLRAGELYTLLHRWTAQEADLNRAQNYYQRLIQSYPKSSLVDDARLAIAYLYLDRFNDPAQAWLRFQDVVRLSPAGDCVPAAKQQLRKLARYAQPDPPALPAGDIPDPACPTPAAPAASPPAAPTAGKTQPESLVVPQPSAATVLPPAPAARPAQAGAPAQRPSRVTEIRHWSNPEYTRVVVSLERETNFFSNLLEDRSGGGKPPRLYLDLFASQVEGRFCKPIDVNDGILLGIRAAQYTPESVRIVLDIDRLQTYRVFPMQNPFRIVIDITGGETPPAAEPPAAGPPVAAVRPAGGVVPSPAPIAAEPVPALAPLPPLGADESPQASSRAPAPAAPAAHPPPTAALSTPAPDAAAPQAPAPAGPPQSPPAAADAAQAPVAAPPKGTKPTAPARTPAPPPADGKLSLARQLGLGVRRVVIDAGHGAHDPGAPGLDGLQEKDVTLDIALRLRELLQAAGYQVVLTRERDVYLPLEERTALANTARGDLFISLHCNASDAGNLSGVETYYLNLASSRRAMATAARENSMALANMSDLQGLLKQIYTSKMDESSRFADAVQRALHGALRRKYPDVKDLGVKQAPFYVLIGAQMPSVLAEISFINHPKEGRRLADPAYRQIVAQALADGVKRYVRTVKTADAAPLPGRER